METQLSKYTIANLTDQDMQWFVETAAVNMLTNELGKPDYVNMENLYVLASMGAMSGTAFVVKADGEPVGALGALLTPNLYNPDITMLAEMFWYVLPEYREGRAGSLLLKAFMERAKEVADESSLSLLHTSAVHKESLERKGYHLKEFAFYSEHRRT